MHSAKIHVSEQAMGVQPEGYTFVRLKMDQQPFIITIVGAESSGKTTLARKLAEYFGCPWVPEYAREYLEGLDRPYTLEDLHAIAAFQMERILVAIEEMKLIGNRQLAIGNALKDKKLIGNRQLAIRNALKDKKLIGNRQLAIDKSITDIDELLAGFELHDQSPLIVDGGMLTLRMWARIKYGIKIPLVEEALLNDITSLYLLCRPLNDWEPDPMREAPNLIDRAWIYNQYLKELVENELPFQFVPSTSF